MASIATGEPSIATVDLATLPKVGKNAGKSPRFYWSAPRAPVHPGHFLETRYLTPGKISQDALAIALGISRRRINTPDTAVRLALHFGTDVAFWLEMQFAWDLHQARQMYFKHAKPVA